MVQNKVLISKVTRTSLLLALLIVAQVVTKTLGQIVTGSIVNFILALSAFTLGLNSSLIISIVSPFLAFLLGIGTPIIQIVPLIALGNVAYVSLIVFVNKKLTNRLGKNSAIVGVALIKFLILYLLVTKIALPLLNLPEAKVKVLSIAFSYPQLITALIGGLVATQIIPIIQKAFKK